MEYYQNQNINLIQSMQYQQLQIPPEIGQQQPVEPSWDHDKHVSKHFFFHSKEKIIYTS